MKQIGCLRWRVGGGRPPSRPRLEGVVKKTGNLFAGRNDLQRLADKILSYFVDIINIGWISSTLSARRLGSGRQVPGDTFLSCLMSHCKKPERWCFSWVEMSFILKTAVSATMRDCLGFFGIFYFWKFCWQPVIFCVSLFFFLVIGHWGHWAFRTLGNNQDFGWVRGNKRWCWP